MGNRENSSGGQSTNSQFPTTIFIVGPTASGKSGLAMEVARMYNGEIVCADSQTIRKDLDIGTAKPTAEDRLEIPHHMLDVIGPYDRYTVAEYVAQAEKAIQDIITRKKLPIVVGGTGLYVDALLYGFQFRPSVGSQSRSDLEQKSINELQEIITSRELMMPENKQNPRHLIRTIESDGAESGRQDLRVGAIVIGLNLEKDVLRSRIKGRAEKMVTDGLFEEIDSVLKKWGEPTVKIDAIAYNIALESRRQNGTFNKDEFLEMMEIGDRQYAKKQRAWFKRNNDISWFNSDKLAFEHIKKLF